MTTLLPWQQHQWQLWQRYKQHRLPQALLLVGPHCVGKRKLAQMIAASLHCLTPTPEQFACHHCKMCLLFNSHNHPNYLEITSEGKSDSIKIEQIRSLQEQLTTTAFLPGPRTIVISPANSLNIAASNALLKILEEPREHTLFILTTDSVSHVLPTISSRCQKMACAATTNEVLPWLSELNLPLDNAHYFLHSPLVLKEQPEQLEQLAELSTFFGELMRNQISVTKMAASLKEKIPLQSMLHWLMHWTTAMINHYYKKPVPSMYQIFLTPSLSIKLLYTFWDELLQLQHDIMIKKMNFNQQLVMENLLFDWLVIGKNNSANRDK